MGTVILIRHGEAEGNLTHRLIGWSDVALTPKGNQQATLVARRLADLPIDRLISSDLLRTRQTATPIAQATGLDLVTDERIREIDNGVWTGLEPAEILEGWPEIWTRYTGGEDVDRPDGERWADVAERVVGAVNEYLAFEGVSVLVTHGGPALITAAWAAGVPLRGNIFKGPLVSADNTSLCTVTSGPRLVGYNDVGHLADLAKIDLPYSPVE